MARPTDQTVIPPKDHPVISTTSSIPTVRTHNQSKNMRRPNTFIVGAPKCGTTALFHYLQDHPDVFGSRVKEPHYFCTDFAGLRRFPTEEEYLALFAAANDQPIVVEATSRYLHSREAIKNIEAFQPAAKYIVMLRNPIELVGSYHAQLVSQFFEDQTDLEAAWRLQESRRSGQHIPATCPCVDELMYGSVARLGELLTRMLAIAPRERVHVIVYDDFRSAPREVYRDTLRFLGIGDDGRSEFPPVNPHKKYRSQWIAELVFKPPYPLNRVKQQLKSMLGLHETRTGKWIYQQLVVPAERPRLSPSLREEFVAYFADDVERLSQLLNRDFRHWLCCDESVSVAVGI